jgi:phenylacetate-CoA ligase
MGRDEFFSWQRNTAWDIIKHHYRNNDFYRQKVGAHLPQQWEDLPIITKKDLQKPLKEIVTKGTDLSKSYVGSTSGSSGTPFFFAKDKFTHAMTWAVIHDRYRLYGLTSHDRQARFYGIPKEFTGYWKERAKDLAMNRLRFPVFDLSDAAMIRFLELFRSQRFGYLYGYTNALVLFARFLIRNGVVLKNECPSLKICISTSEVCTPEDDLLLEKAFGIRHIREYGASETCLMAFDSPDGQWRMTEETIYNEVVSEDGHPVPAGQTGNVLCTSLFNTALPMIRYQIGDMAVLGERSQNSIYRSIQKLMGRTNDTAVLPSGKVAAGLTFYYISRSILESSGVLKEFIIRQTETDHFVFDIVADRDLSISEKEEIEAKIATYLEPGLRLTINRVEQIDRPASGKLKHFYSELTTN